MSYKFYHGRLLRMVLGLSLLGDKFFYCSHCRRRPEATGVRQPDTKEKSACLLVPSWVATTTIPSVVVHEIAVGAWVLRDFYGSFSHCCYSC